MKKEFAKALQPLRQERIHERGGGNFQFCGSRSKGSALVAPELDKMGCLTTCRRGGPSLRKNVKEVKNENWWQQHLIRQARTIGSPSSEATSRQSVIQQMSRHADSSGHRNIMGGSVRLPTRDCPNNVRVCTSSTHRVLTATLSNESKRKRTPVPS